MRDDTTRTAEAAVPASPIDATPGTAEAPAAPVSTPAHPGIVEEVLVEEVSIDGMCGVY